MTTFFISDHHFGHARVLQMNASRRGYADIDEMDRMLISDWSKRVRPEDTIYHLGDFCYRNSRPASYYFERLPGTKHLIRGNHDGEATLALPWASVTQIADIAVDGQRICLCHYPLLEWPAFHRGAIHLFGHVHGNRKGVEGSLDVGVDAIGSGYPLSLADVLRRIGRSG